MVALVVAAPLLVTTHISVAAASTPSAAQGWIRFGHFAYGVSAVSVSLDGKTIDANAGFEAVTPYQSVTAGHHELTVTELHAPGTVVQTAVTVGAGAAITVAGVDGPKGMIVDWFTDNLAPAPSGDAKVRFIDAVAADSSLNASLSDPKLASAGASTTASVGPIVIDGATYGSASPYANVPAGSYNVDVSKPGGAAVVMGTSWPVTAGTVASLVVLQDGTSSTLEVLVDAAQAGQLPSGGMATGYGGAAKQLAASSGGSSGSSGEGTWMVGVAVAGIMLGVGAGWWLARRPRRSRRSSLLAGTVVLVGLVAVLIPAASRTSTTAAPVVVPTGSPADVHVATALRRSSTQPHINVVPTATVSLADAAQTAPTARPQTVQIPSLGISAPVVSLDRLANGTAQVPATTTEVGWYSNGPLPGQTGPAVLLGHVDSTSGPGVFFRLRDLTAGAVIEVTEGHSVVSFSVQRVAVYGKSSFPTGAVFGPTPDRALRVITCGGPFDYSTGHYLDNVVVYATESSATSA
jgi:sortase (surface protein transpeptidase)